MKHPSRMIESALSHGLLLIATLFALYPVLWVVTMALTHGGLPTSDDVVPLPHEPTMENFSQVTGVGTAAGPALFLRQLTNSLVVALATALTAVVIATPAAYALSRFAFVGRDLGLRVLLATQMFPAVASAIPLYLLLDGLRLLDTRSGLVLVYASSAVPFAVFQLRGAFASIPVALEEAAMVDGATRFQAFLRVVLPAARPAIAVAGLFAFMSAWNEFILAATFLSREETFTLPVVLQRYVGDYTAAWGAFAAGALLVTAPVMALFYFTQRQFVAGLTAGGVKG
jgi:arabinogalactan oligomer/maltooligosaccharide transport system permease protein